MGHFEFDGDKYKKASRHQKEWGSRLIADLSLKGDESILDLGCGDGVLTEQLARLVPKGRVSGLDASSGMIATAETLAGDNLRFFCKNIDDMDFVDEFDIIFSNATLHWVHDHERLLNNCYRALKPGGIIQWNFAAAGTCETFNVIAKAVMRESDYRDYFTDFVWPWFMPTVEAYEKLLADFDFVSATVDYENADRYFADCDEMIRWIDQPSLVPFLARDLAWGFQKLSRYVENIRPAVGAVRGAHRDPGQSRSEGNQRKRGHRGADCGGGFDRLGDRAFRWADAGGARAEPP